MFAKLLILSIVFLAIGALGLGVKILLKKKGQFPETHISRNPAMRARGIKCAQKTDTGCNPADGYPGCSCSRGLAAD
ncbi:MAG: hypothetical protein MUE32_10945 [Bacteroidales bacterium]|jgi:hypothetical protein|nr:hypothetical protein [Bacteroidales bacterium]